MITILSRWRAAEPVRVYIYSVMVPALLVAVGYGLVSGAQATLWLTLAAAVLGVGSTEAARSNVTPWQPPPAEH